MTDLLSQDTILEGAVGIYRRVDLDSGWGDSSSLIPFDSDLKSLHFKLAGDLICSALSGILRCYVHLEEGMRVVLAIAVKERTLYVVGLIFESEFADGASLTTTTSAATRTRTCSRRTG